MNITTLINHMLYNFKKIKNEFEVNLEFINAHDEGR